VQFDVLSRVIARRKYDIFIFLLAIIVRIITWVLIPVDWNWDSYHHWQISYMSLHIGFREGRLWDLNGCEYIWGIVPHIFQSSLLYLFNTSKILPYRIFNLLAGSLNSLLVFYIGRSFYNFEIGYKSGIIYALFPVAAVFDIIAMQDTIALTFLLSSLYFIKIRPFWSGILLALAGQSRTELLLIGFVITSGYILRERLSTWSQPFIIGYMLITGIFGIHLVQQTGNPIFPLYYSLNNIFGGMKNENEGIHFLNLMLRWLIWKLNVWPRKITGITLLFAAFTTAFLIPYMAWKKWLNYQPILYSITTLAILSPVFLTYIGSDFESFLIMLRMINPITALSIPILIHLFKRYMGSENKKMNDLPFLFSLIFLIFSFTLIPPHYSVFQDKATDAFYASDKVFEYYNGGTIVSDYPTMNYWLIQKYELNAKNIIGNHYSPYYYKVETPSSYAQWLSDNNVTLWIYWDDRAKPVWEIISLNYPGLLILLEDLPAANIFLVDQNKLLEILENSNN
jgi:hypothetical protein